MSDPKRECLAQEAPLLVNTDSMVLRQFLQATFISDGAKPPQGQSSHERLNPYENSPEFGLSLMLIVDDANTDLPTRLAAAVALKNYVRKYWPEPDKTETIVVPEATCDLLKRELVPLMYRVPQIIQKNITETVNNIAWIDFPGKWPHLLTDLTASFDSGEPDLILASLRTAHGLFKHYRAAEESGLLWKEIRHVLEEFAPKFTTVFLDVLARIPDLQRLSREGGDQIVAKEGLKIAFHIVLYCCKIYHSLISQELPQIFADQLPDWLGIFRELLEYENTGLRSDNGDEPGVLNVIKSEICGIITLLAFKYDEDFHSHVDQFVYTVIILLKKTTQLVQDELLTFSAMEFLSRILAQNRLREVFLAAGLLEDICEKIILPNIQFRQSDADDFEHNPEDFIRRDIEGSDMHTRRRAAADLVRAATKFHKEHVTKCLAVVFRNLIAEYQKDTACNWVFKDTAIFLTAILAAEGQVARSGATAVNPVIDIISFFANDIVPHLQSDADHHPVLQADCLKFIVTFRAKISVEDLVCYFPTVVRQLDSPFTVVHTYAAHCIERIFSMRDKKNRLIVEPMWLEHYLETLTGGAPNPNDNLFSHLMALRPDTENPDGQIEENEYTVYCVPCPSFNNADCHIIRKLFFSVTKRAAYAVKNPGNARYDYYLFESLALCIRIACSVDAQDVEMFEKQIMPVATVVLRNSVEAFFPYIFQLFTQLLENREGIMLIPSEYITVLDRLLNPALLRENEILIPSVVRLLGAFFEVSASQIVGKLENTLELFKMLVVTPQKDRLTDINKQNNQENQLSKKYDHEGFALLRSVIDKTPFENLKNYITWILSQFFERLTTNLVPTLYLMVVRIGSATFIQYADEVQKNVFGMLLERIMLPEMLKVQPRLSRKLCITGCVLLLTDTVTVFGGPYDAHWKNILETTVKLIELPPEKEVAEDLQSDDLISDDPIPPQATTQSQLVFAQKAERDYIGDVGDVRVFLVTNLAALSTIRPGLVLAKLRDSIPEVQTFVDAYCRMASIILT